MSISAPEAHHYDGLSESAARQATDYVDGLANLASIMTSPLPAVDQTTKAARQVVTAESPPNGDPASRHKATERLQRLDDSTQSRALQLARTAIVVSMANELVQHAHDSDATPESRRLAIELARSALGRHHARTRRGRSPITHPSI